MNYFPYINILISLAIVSLMNFMMFWILDFINIKSHQKMIFLKINLVILILFPFIYSLSSLYFPNIIDITLPSQLIHEPITSKPYNISAAHQVRWPVYFICLYSIGLSFMLFRVLLSFLNAKKQLRSSYFTIIQDKKVFINNKIKNPLSFGFPKAKIYLPIDAETRWNPREIQMILAHENIHVKRNDCLWKLLSLVVQSFLFFAPWVFYLHRRLELEMEIFCDLKTCEQTKADVREYGTLLLAITSAQPQNLIFNNMTDSTLKRRFIAMKSKTINSKILIISTIFLALAGSTVIAMADINKVKNTFKITTKILIDGKIVSSPQIITEENQLARITITNKDKTSGDGLRMKLIAKNAKTLSRNNAIEINYDLQFKNGNAEIETNPQITVTPNQETKINISSDSHHSYDMIILAERE